MPVTFFADKQYQKYTKNKIQRVKIATRDLMVDVVENGKIVVNPSTHAYGVFDANNKFVKSSLQYKGKTHQFIPKYPSGQIDVMNGDAVFMGYVVNHFGHFLIEQLSRAWGVLKHRTPGMKFVFVNNRGIVVPGYVYKFMKLLNISESDVMVLDAPCKFNRVFIPEQSFRLSNTVYCAPEFVTAFREMAHNTKSKYDYDKVYVSRAKLPNDIRTYGEEKIQNIFQDNGFTVIYPETLDLFDQVAIMKNCRVLAGCAGTALHLALFMENAERVIQIKRNTINNDSAYVQYAINTLVGADSVFVSGSVEKYKSGHGGNHAPQIIGITDDMARFFDCEHFVYSDTSAVAASDWDSYETQLKLFQENNGGAFILKVKKRFIKYISCLVPGRINRDRFRRWLKNHL
ncbi:MAG: glycosyltransferase family 61 protein [Alphaproteobacteria bacterium]|nr:glycosyltransferase family 61 protein [Alphaproteobacteria bacterium]